MKRVKIEVGQIWIIPYTGIGYTITTIGNANRHNHCKMNCSPYSIYPFGIVGEDGLTEISDELVLSAKEIIIPGTPLDPNFPILHAGYIQDRQRKLFKKQRTK